MNDLSIQSNPSNSNPLQFIFDGHPVRIIPSEDGEPLFVAKDVCDALELYNVSQAISRLDEDEKRTVISNDSLSRNPNLVVVTEPGLYSLVIRCDKPKAKEFKRWITHDVLPQIRKTGTYESKELSPMDILRQMFVTYDKQQAENEQRFSAIEGHVQGLDHDVHTLMALYPDTYTVKSYFNHIGRKEPDIATLRAIGKLAKANSGRAGMLVRQAQEGAYLVWMYHENILREIVAGMDNDNPPPKSKQLKF